jgi:hypothetical protein
MDRTILQTGIFYEKEPKSIERLDAQSYYVNFDIVPKTIINPDGETVEGFTCTTLYIEGLMTKDRITKGWLDVFYPVDKELKLINDFNDGLNIDAYHDYLEKRRVFKEFVHTLIFE